ncbi:hypothetical protein QR685DRAFT_201944 [Neurospora intermedia]|uniref:Uncharacterized protein n=1 Tax=Neurospora intermedia TaxID=5142 RepID=A0ABR3DFC0_NEUIN
MLCTNKTNKTNARHQRWIVRLGLHWTTWSFFFLSDTYCRFLSQKWYHLRFASKVFYCSLIFLTWIRIMRRLPWGTGRWEGTCYDITTFLTAALSLLWCIVTLSGYLSDLYIPS